MNEPRRRRSTVPENTPLSSNVLLPDELIVQILLRLPVSSLVRFKCVSKLWLSLISDPQFAKSHFDLAASPTHRLFLNCSDKLQIQSLDIESSPPPNDEEESAVFNYVPSDSYIIFARSTTRLEFLGSCRGFLLLATHQGSFIVCNPSTGVHRRIPSTSFSYSLSSLYGIGYDESTDDYLLVSVRSNQRTDRLVFAARIEVFSLKTNLPLPLTLDDDEYGFTYFGSRSNLFLHGSLHWLAVPIRGVTYSCVVLAFDLIGRSLSEIPLSPDLALELNTKLYSLREMRGCLCLCISGSGGMTEIWIMKEYKVQSSWTKIVLSAHGVPHTYRNYPICFTNCGDLIGSNVTGRLFRLNDKGKLLAVWPGESKFSLLHSGMYTASLLSLPS